MKNEFNTKNLPNPPNFTEAAPNLYYDNNFNDSSIKKNTTHFDFN